MSSGRPSLPRRLDIIRVSAFRLRGQRTKAVLAQIDQALRAERQPRLTEAEL